MKLNVFCSLIIVLLFCPNVSAKCCVIHSGQYSHCVDYITSAEGCTKAKVTIEGKTYSVGTFNPEVKCSELDECLGCCVEDVGSSGFMRCSDSTNGGLECYLKYISKQGGESRFIQHVNCSEVDECGYGCCIINVNGYTGCWEKLAGYECHYKASMEDGTPNFQPDETPDSCLKYSACTLGCCVVGGGVSSGGFCFSDKDSLGCHKLSTVNKSSSLVLVNGSSCVGVPECTLPPSIIEKLISIIRDFLRIMFG